jgi:2-dehydro-3-deoxyphosphogluconate aldolase/(4S)-4-hydroxy-2-oxoglutarate aldolase
VTEPPDVQNTFQLAHVGINNPDAAAAQELCDLFCLMFNLDPRQGKKSEFAGTFFECVRSQYLGTHGHIGMSTDDLEAAVEELTAKGFGFDQETAAHFEDGRLQNIYLAGEFGGFAVHVMQQPRP